MPRLFWKFFLVFWLAVLLATAGTATVIWLRNQTETSPAFSGQLPMGGPPPFLLQTLSTLAEHGGEAALREVLNDWREPFSVYALIDNQELLDRHPDPTAVEEARRAVESGVSGNAREITLDDGHQLLLFVTPGGLPDPMPIPNNGDPTLAPPPPLPFAEGGPAFTPPPPPPLWLPLASGLGASLLFSALLAWYLVKPIRHLRKALDSAGEGALDVRVQPLMGNRRDEIADLGREFDHMAKRLQETILAQRRLFQDVSHELRSPLARLEAVVGLMRQDDHGDGMTINRIEREVRRIDELVGELLLLARIESGAPGAPIGEIDLIDLVDGIIADARFEAERRNCSVEFHCDEELMLSGRVDVLGRAIENVIRNAIKYTAEASVVSIKLESITDNYIIQLSICDQGPGISPREQETIFEPFFRAGQTNQQRGFGLGLAIARRAVEAHGGAIHAENQPHGGLCMIITLPMEKTA